MTNAPVLSVTSLTKRFGSVVANREISLDVRPGEIHALLGENGAGKTTLMNVMYGLVTPDAGTLQVRGEPYRPAGPHEAIRAGIGMVHQHFMLIPTFTVTENVVLGAEPTRNAVLDFPAARNELRDLSRRYGLAVDPDALVQDLPVGIQQRVEILKALYRQADLLILDEPTAVLAPPEVDQLFRVMRELAATGRAILFISHKLREVLSIADRITVLRGGEVVGDVRPAETTEADLAAMMVGRPVRLTVDRTPASPGEPVLRISGLQVRDRRGGLAVRDLDLTVRAGEIVGIAGVEGNGQTEFIEAITGLRAIDGGGVYLCQPNQEIRLTGASPRQIQDHGIRHIPEDRQKFGLVLSHTLADNLILNQFDCAPFARGLRRMFDAVARFARCLMAEHDIRASSHEARTGTLSGGNQQKAVVARELDGQPRLLIAAQPTRGVDVGATELIHRRIQATREQGAGVLLISSELDELLSLADRIVVMYGGRITATVDALGTSRDRLGMLIAGAAAPPAD
ncbi:MAG: ABC transporter ATP-binding protein [Chloroflexota bacterium]